MNKDYVFIWLPFYLTSLLGLLYFLENPCMYPWQFASDGSRCGGRASSIRVDGKNPTEFWFFWSIFFFGSIYLLYRVYLPRLKSFIAGDGWSKAARPFCGWRCRGDLLRRNGGLVELRIGLSWAAKKYWIICSNWFYFQWLSGINRPLTQKSRSVDSR